MSLPALTIKGSKLVDPSGNVVTLRGLSSQGMAMVYGDKANPRNYYPGTVGDYVATAASWAAKAVRLGFEPFPQSDPGRLDALTNAQSGYRAGIPYAIPETLAYPTYPGAKAKQGFGECVQSNGNCYQAVMHFWAADEGQAWNLPPYGLGDVVVGLNTTHVYVCTAPATGLTGDWASGPSAMAADFVDGHGAHWQYVGEWGTTGGIAPSGTGAVVGHTANILNDGLVQWLYLFPATDQPTREAAFADWKSKVLDASVQAAVDHGMYVVINLFEFGSPLHPLTFARLTDFWSRIAKSQWANHPNVLFELWNESYDLGGFPGNPGTWTIQKPAIQTLVNTIRTAGANNVIIVPSPFFSAWIGETTANPLTGPNLGYGFHQYKSEFDPNPSNQQQLTQALASGQAVFVTEFGDDTNPTDPADTWLNTILPIIDPAAAGIFAWALTNSWSPSLCSDAALTIPTPYGQAVKNWFSGVPMSLPQTAAPLVDPIAAPAVGAPIIITGKLAPVVVVVIPPPADPPPQPPATKTPAQLAAAASLAAAQANLAAANALVAAAQAVVTVLA